MFRDLCSVGKDKILIPMRKYPAARREEIYVYFFGYLRKFQFEWFAKALSREEPIRLQDSIPCPLAKE